MSQPSSTKAYLIRAVHEWCMDNNFTPYVVVKVNEHTRVPMQHVREGQIVLNVSPFATGGLQIGNDDITCQARFGGVAQSLYVPISQVLALYARENGQGIAFSDGAYSGSGMEMGVVAVGDVQIGTKGPAPADKPEPPAPGAPSGGKVSHLRRVK